MNLSGKTALVTGASRGIGHAIALELGRNGATVFGTATTLQGAENITAALQLHGCNGQGLVLDVNAEQAAEKLLAEICQAGSVPAILVNNAAITRDNILLRLKNEDWDSVINTNLNAVFRLTKVFIKAMVKAHYGRIINISSVVGITGNSGQTNYAAAKAGLIGFTKALALEVASREITINAVAPGFIDTDMTRTLTAETKENLLNTIPLHRLGQPEEIAAVVNFLASPLAGYITGQTIHVNGGMYMN